MLHFAVTAVLRNDGASYSHQILTRQQKDRREAVDQSYDGFATTIWLQD